MLLTNFQCLPGTKQKLRLVLSSLDYAARRTLKFAPFFSMDLEISEIKEINRFRNLTREAIEAIFCAIKEKSLRKEGELKLIDKA